MGRFLRTLCAGPILLCGVLLTAAAYLLLGLAMVLVGVSIRLTWYTDHEWLDARIWRLRQAHRLATALSNIVVSAYTTDGSATVTASYLRPKPYHRKRRSP